jgi:hypothetical protein
MQESVKTDTISIEEKLKIHNWLCTLAFLADLKKSELFQLETSTRKPKYCAAYESSDFFRRKLSIFKDNMQKNYPTHFKDCKITNVALDNADFTHFADCTGELEQEFQNRFSDFDNMKTILHLFSNPLGSKVEEQDHDLQMEMCKLQSDLFLVSKSSLQY